MKHAFLLVFLCVLTVAPAWAQPEKPALETAGAVITLASGKTVSFTVEIAATPDVQRKGLMFRRTLPDKHGMLFVFPQERMVHFWMKNTFVSLDMLFMDAKGRIVNIAADTKPLSERMIPSGTAVKSVLEVAGGSARKYGIAPGDQFALTTPLSLPGRHP